MVLCLACTEAYPDILLKISNDLAKIEEHLLD